MYAGKRAAQLPKPCIFAIGNAPTALVSLEALMEADKLHPALIIGVPVGFVNVIESKELVIANCRAPYIVARGRKSNAFAISKRLGIDEAILEQARSLVSQNDVNFEDVLTQLDQQRQEMEKAKEEAERLRRETEKQKEKSDEYYAQIKQEKEKAAQQARKEAQYIIDDARRAADAVYEELKQLRKQAKNGAFVPGSNEKQAQMRRSLNEAESRMQPQREEKQRPEPTRAIRVGDTVELLKLGTKASVLAINKDGSYQLRAGIMQITAKPVIAGKVRELKAAAQPELDIRGMAVDEALPVLDNFLDAAYMGNLPNARIIHGKGTGVLRAAVQEELRRCKYVKSFRLGVYGEGESGVTIVEFK